MVFIDGSNFLIQLCKELEITNFRAERPPHSIFTLAEKMISKTTHMSRYSSEFALIRRYWFSSYAGNDKDYSSLRIILRELDFEPILFKKHQDKKEKGVDIALTKEMLVNAFNSNFDIAILFAGDEDYVSLVNEVKRYGPIIMGAFFKNGLSPNLQFAFDYFQLITLEDEEREKMASQIREVM
ncbi:MAG: NYN domain-containing protein [Candidatus Contubernalis sp.]|nr:NYN domain-containing protein [Candidatus Contubernalis sp.]